MLATIPKLPFCTEEFVLVEGLNFSSIRYMDPITQILYHNNTIAVINLLYPNVVKREDGSFEQYGETLKKFHRKIYQWSMNSNLNVSDENLQRCFLSTSYIKQSQTALEFAIIVNELSVGSIPRFGWKKQSRKYYSLERLVSTGNFSSK